MHTSALRLSLLAKMVLMCGSVLAQEFVLPYKPDPPIVVDAQLDDWVRVPNPLLLKEKRQVTYGAELWTGPEDLSGEVRLAWREGGLLVAAEVRDGKIIQTRTGRDLWQGDHVCIWIDTIPGEEAGRDYLGKGQYVIGLSPGNFQVGPAGSEPEMYVFKPDDVAQPAGQIAARRTEEGYVLEAFIPLQPMGIRPLSQGQEASFEVAISDCDSTPSKQDSMITSSQGAWDTKRSRLLPMVFGDANGKAAPVVRGTIVLDEAEIAPGASQTAQFKIASIPPEKIPCVSVEARVQFSSVAGYSTNTLKLTVNGKPVEVGRLMRRPATFTMRDGRSLPSISAEGLLTLPLAPDFESIDSHSDYGIREIPHACQFEFDLSGLVRPGENELVISNHAVSDPSLPYVAHVKAVTYSEKAKPQPPVPPKPAPTGEIPVIQPKKDWGDSFSSVDHTASSLRFSIADESFTVTSRYSSPDGRWNQGSNTYFRHERKIIRKPLWIEIHDTFTNLTDRDLPLMQEHECKIGDSMQNAWLGGLRITSVRSSREDHQNPSAVASTSKTCLGLLPLNDEFIIHSTQNLDGRKISLMDHQLYVPPKGTYTSEWAVVGVTSPDFWTWVNAARQLRDANFTLPYSFAFLFKTEPVYDWSEATLRGFITSKGINFAVKGGDEVVNKDGHYARVTDWLNASPQVYKDFQARISKLFPEGKVKTGIYFDPWLDTTEGNVARFAQDRATDSTGRQIDYGGIHTYLKMFLPTTRPGGFGEELAKVIDRILELSDGVYWDEFDLACAKFSYNHDDGASADIDQQTFQIVRKKGALALVSREWNLSQVKKILAKGRPLLVNAAPATRTLRKLKFQSFCETGSISNCRAVLLYSPCALGDHLTEASYLDAYRVMHGALDNGCVYSWYVPKFHEHLAPTAFMFPITPVELHEGYILGEERIITNRSGYFGWGDSSGFTAHVFNREGMPDEEFVVPKVVRDGSNFAEVRLPEGYMAILIRRK